MKVKLSVIFGLLTGLAMLADASPLFEETNTTTLG
jgi:hypothetical protein